MATTAKAAFLINGVTVHSKLKIYGREYTELDGNALGNFQEEMKNVAYLIVDECSMIGQ
jgi:hypothetical protein